MGVAVAYFAGAAVGDTAPTPPIIYGVGRSDPNVQTNLVMESTDDGKNCAQSGCFSALATY